jgi:hypothetical protein
MSQTVGLGRCHKAQRFPVERGAVRKRDGHVEGGFKTSPQVRASDILRLNHETVAGSDVLADQQHLALHL